MYRYYVYDKTRMSWHFIELSYEAQVGEIVNVNYGSNDSPVICECEIVRVMSK